MCVQKREMGERKKTREGGREGRQVRQREMEERSNASGKRKKEKKSISPLSQRPESAHQLFSEKKMCVCLNIFLKECTHY